MMRYVGLDLRKKTLVVCAFDRRGKAVFAEGVHERPSAKPRTRRAKAKAK